MSRFSNDDVRRLSGFTSPQTAEAFSARTVVLVEGLEETLTVTRLGLAPFAEDWTHRFLSSALADAGGAFEQ